MPSKLLEIISAWAISMNPTDEQLKTAKKRLSICDKCESSRYKKAIDLHYCGECGCPLNKKAFSPLPGKDVCPLKKWDV